MVRVAQETPYYCGPAVVQMLATAHRIFFEQTEVVIAGGVSQKIKEKGMTIAEIAQAMSRILPSHLPNTQFWYKPFSTISELSQLVNVFEHPVGVEWQGLFDYPDEEDDDEDDDDDPGHYSIITAINTRDNIVRLADPDRHYAGNDRRFSIMEFERRWWDINQIVDPITASVKEIDDYHMMFIIARAEESFPEDFGMLRR
ncbi:MAG: hypothetical protein UX04_C0005G0043 [Microgenomates group bacterium GW2011_GWF2_45_18]|nr:MAG: hypothetical protein UW18_C0007G0044 [Microgenomates group bacterium GW2011_GWF1_44_10]KKU01624.1 MAG: hypothetical protein UX04_C0005G0043 [Microgenomates group bacterium GW2011_GWF2_45_18]